MSLLEVSPDNMRFMEVLGDSITKGTDNHIKQTLIANIPGGTPANEREQRVTQLETFDSLQLEQELEAINYGRNYYDIMDDEVIDRMRAEPLTDVDEDTKLVFLGNLLVENGHAEYDRVISRFFEFHPAFRRWKNLWVAEEKTHGDAMEKWAWMSKFLDMQVVHGETQAYLRHGLTLDFITAAHSVLYPALQEDLTENSHSKVANRLPKKSESFAGGIGKVMMGGIVRNERGHKVFYTDQVREGFDSDDMLVASMLMIALRDAGLGIAMPGMDSDIRIRNDCKKAYIRTEVFTPVTFASELLIPVLGEEDRYNWRIRDVENLTDEAKQAREESINFVNELIAVEGDLRGTLKVILAARKKRGKIA